MNADEKSRRIRRRLELVIPVRVRGRDSADHEWTEMTRLINVTPFGARLKLTRPTEVGRLLHVTIAMPRAMRCFDHAEDQNRVYRSPAKWSMRSSPRLQRRTNVVRPGTLFLLKWISR